MLLGISAHFTSKHRVWLGRNLVVHIHCMARAFIQTKHAHIGLTAIVWQLPGKQQQRQFGWLMAIEHVPHDSSRHRPEHVAGFVGHRPDRAGQKAVKFRTSGRHHLRQGNRYAEVL